jgi:hypothetical protein
LLDLSCCRDRRNAFQEWTRSLVASISGSVASASAEAPIQCRKDVKMDTSRTTRASLVMLMAVSNLRIRHISSVT